ncbi:retron St85 family RNA-directed DNA polymerase [Vibrio cholerae]|uniref:RNA-directed DNA polymerase n=1 Tax=Vibrio metoecus TaxID=1481663 RepID=A0A0Q0TFX1_VIBMT|nr:retron St85 family RNA-directed DNA polymerase [Vibrio metoecus]EIO3984710.1 retron St85 family RNA-directed DNA polymerase [Vibrio vulnificus]EJC6751962.1 retron St85 family RNA-directed DNA polymerase [Vibrio parahaemolyticus]EJL6640730.1 retron St85 family RNA-directed DNA polymerase [Vibrio cholerae]EJG0492848.1 retron St85 family RNA-directed DNA polymerase [Vibrio parahaemolyticus]EJV9309685.1 retron St85 family RNA-directed DNA polymerase [Vibrio vulnificus]
MNLSEILASSLFMDDEEIRSFAASSPYRYKVYTIAKRNSQERRVIAHPSKELKFIQRLIVSLLEKRLPIHYTAKAYTKGLSIKDNAQPHMKSKYLLKMDLKDFFPSIKPSLFFRECRVHGVELSELDVELLEGFLFWKRRRATQLVLSIGAPSSPIVSNFILYRFDEVISEYCMRLGINYTRYADDLTFSTNEKDLLIKFPARVRKVLNHLYDGQIKVNLKKTVLSSKAHNRHVTGITLSNDGKLSVGREKKRKLSASIHHFIMKKLSVEEILKLKGELAHTTFIEPLFLERMIEKYGYDAINELKHFSDESS